MEAASAAWKGVRITRNEKKWLHIHEPSGRCLQNLKPKHPVSGALKARNPETVCLVSSNQGEPWGRYLVLVAVKVISSLRTTGVRDVAGNKLDVWYTVESHITIKSKP